MEEEKGVITATWRKEYRSRTFTHANYFCPLPRGGSAHVTYTSRGKEKRNSVMQSTKIQNDVLYSIVKNTYFPYKTRYSFSGRNTNSYRITICKIGESNKQKRTLQFSINASKRFYHVGVPSFRLLWLLLYALARYDVPCCL